MGTLTANQGRLPEHCEHKLPTSCRLSSISRCCACADERAHAAAYSTYIDGVGFVPRGTRWNRYCWFCKEFWENRVRASGLTPAQSRIPGVPDQTLFLERWYEFHRGYRTVKKDDGSEERVAVLGEDFKDVSPGCLPQTLEELRAGLGRRDMAEPRQNQVQAAASSINIPEEASLEDTLEQMLQAASAEEVNASQVPAHGRVSLSSHTIGAPSAQPDQLANDAELPGVRSAINIQAQSIVPAGTRNREYQARRIASLRRELNRMRSGIERVISGLRDLGENVPDQTQATGSLTELGRTLDVISGTSSMGVPERIARDPEPSPDSHTVSRGDARSATIEARVQEAQHHVDEARRTREQAASEVDLAEQELRTSMQRLQRLQREQRSTENYVRVFGTREEMVAQGENYESPIGGMFTRAMDRFRAAEEVRREERTLRQVLVDEASSGGEGAVERLTEILARGRDVWGVPRPHVQDVEAGEQAGMAPSEQRDELDEDLAQQSTQRESVLDQIADTATPLLRETPSMTDDFPSNMMNALVATRELQDEESSVDLFHPLDYVRENRPYLIDNEAPQEVQYMELLASYRADPGRSEVDHALLRLAEDHALRESVQWDVATVRRLVIGRQYNNTTSSDQDRLKRLLRNISFVWQIGIPSHRARAVCLISRRYNIEPEIQVGGLQGLDEIEAMAEAFQQSSEIRHASALTASQQLRILYRLQRGERSFEDRTVLQQMLLSSDIVELARVVRRPRPGHPQHPESEMLAQIGRQRRHAARAGNHTRQELDQQRRAVSSLALAAGRTAMRTGSHGVLQQMAEQDEQTQAAYQRLQNSGYAPGPDSSAEVNSRETVYRRLQIEDYAGTASDSESEEEEDDAQGLDAAGTGRPEPKTDDGDDGQARVSHLLLTDGRYRLLAVRTPGDVLVL